MQIEVCLPVGRPENSGFGGLCDALSLTYFSFFIDCFLFLSFSASPSFGRQNCRCHFILHTSEQRQQATTNDCGQMKKTNFEYNYDEQLMKLMPAFSLRSSGVFLSNSDCSAAEPSANGRRRTFCSLCSFSNLPC
mmetsp:Transcript_7604/g.14825  ORF Transcript_7604/g.14825 Transcript_7604/m.14825 type:complete len:135 (-) Transcript_7604:2250-2654(-)